MHTALICDSDNDFRKHLKATLLALDVRTVLLCNSRGEALTLAVEHLPQLIVLEAAAPINGLTLAATLQNHLETMTLLTVRPSDRTLLKQATTHTIDAFLAKPLQQDASLTVELAILLARETAHLRSELHTVQTTLKQRKSIEKAKGLLMDRERINEEQAFKKMRSLAMSRRISLALLAEEIIKGGKG